MWLRTIYLVSFKIMWFVTFRSNQCLIHSVHTTFSYSCFLQVEITLQDINDNPPVFPTDMLDLTVEENIGDGSKILQLTAMDADEVGVWLHIWVSVLKMLFWKYMVLPVPLLPLWELGLGSHCGHVLDCGWPIHKTVFSITESRRGKHTWASEINTLLLEG